MLQSVLLQESECVSTSDLHVKERVTHAEKPVGHGDEEDGFLCRFKSTLPFCLRAFNSDNNIPWCNGSVSSL